MYFSFDHPYRLKLKRVAFYLITLFYISFSANANSINFDIESHIGLYEVVGAECGVVQAEFDPCRYTLFFELLKGQFIGVEDNELAYVFWSGDPKIDSELQYESHRIDDFESGKMSGDEFRLNSDGGTQAYLVFSDGNLVAYRSISNADDKIKRRVIRFELKPTRRGNLPFVRMNYPGNK